MNRRRSSQKILGVKASKRWRGLPLFTQADRDKLPTWPY